MEGGGTLRGTVTNSGRVVVGPGLALNAQGDVLNQGEIQVGEGGTLYVHGSYAGAGSITGPGLTRFAGLLAPGNSPALLTIEGAATLEASSETVLEAAGLARGTAYDSLAVGGTLTLGGTLSIALTDGFIPSVGASFILIEAAQLVGSFAASNLPDIAGLRFVLSQDATRLSLSVQAVPIPGAFWLMLGACGALAGWQRRIQAAG